MRLWALSDVATVLIGLGSQAEALEDGSYFLQACNAAIRQHDGERVSAEETVKGVHCLGYIGGFLDGLSLAAGVAKSQFPICLPKKGISANQAARIFVKYLRENPKVLNEPGRDSFVISMRNAFPCK